MKNKEIMTAKELAKYLRVHILTVHRYAREGKIPAFKIAGKWMFHRKLIDRWIKQKINSYLIKKNKNLFNL